ncbi:hypothetical protein SUSAZ_07960 [Sulfolobus acidocaldarius SUSAZ]|nr:hypothetical protein SUSAZ_07960 [Sulfolobus acidocaldarius SUSAZ]
MWVVFSNETTKQYNSASLALSLNNQVASVLGSGLISITNTQVLNVTKLTGNIENGIFSLSGNIKNTQTDFTFFGGYTNGTLLTSSPP